MKFTETFYDYVAKVYHEPISQQQYDEMEKAFMAGVVIGMQRLSDFSELTDEEAIKKISDAWVEAESYFKDHGAIRP